jgi:hypothetical protein
MVNAQLTNGLECKNAINFTVWCMQIGCSAIYRRETRPRNGEASENISVITVNDE